jgi:hypothetical protein
MAVPKEGLKRDLQNLFQSGLAASLLAGGAKHTEALGSRKEAGTAGKGVQRARRRAPLWVGAEPRRDGRTVGLALGGQRP